MSEILDRTIQDTPVSELYLRGVKVCANCKFFGVGNSCKKGVSDINPTCWCNSWRRRHV